MKYIRMGVREKIYNKLPIPLQNMAISWFGISWHKRRYGGIFKSKLQEFRSREMYSSLEWNEYVNIELRKNLLHAFSKVPFYTNSFKKAGLSISDLSEFTLQDLKRLPYLEKNELRQYGTSSLISIERDKNAQFFASSGSTGTPTQIMISPGMHQVWSAGFEARIRNWAGVTYLTPRGTIGGRRIIAEGKNKGPFYRYNFIEKQTYFSAYHISPVSVRNYIEGMRKHHVEYMTGYAMSNYFLARFIEESGLEAPALKAVITSSEKLTSQMRDTFRKVYNCRTYDSYSGVEDCGMISECEHGSLHISPDLGIIEILDQDGNDVKPGEAGEAVCTGLINPDQPLIRYRIGDIIKLSLNQECGCGRNMPVVEEIIGRLEDTIIGKDGREMVRFHGIFINIPRIIEAQVIQHETDRFEIKLVTVDALTAEDTALIRKRMDSQLGPVNVELNRVDFIPRNGNGKFKAVISHVKRNI
jgi:phenylacetate-CoA ligase